MPKKTAKEYELMEEMRTESDHLYAIKLVERIVFGMVGIILIAVLSAIIALVVTR
jgi:hypothetical protein